MASFPLLQNAERDAKLPVQTEAENRIALYYHLKCMQCFILRYQTQARAKIMFFSDAVYLVLAPNSLKEDMLGKNPSARAVSDSGLRLKRDTLTPDSDKTRSVII